MHEKSPVVCSVGVAQSPMKPAAGHVLCYRAGWAVQPKKLFFRSMRLGSESGQSAGEVRLDAVEHGSSLEARSPLLVIIAATLGMHPVFPRRFGSALPARLHSVFSGTLLAQFWQFRR